MWEKPLADNSSAVMVFNRGVAALNVSVVLYDLADNTHATWAVRDVWKRADLGVSSDLLVVEVPPHGVRLLRMRPQQPAPPPPPPAPPPPHPPCPPEFAPHAGGYWHNTDYLGKTPGTVAECAAKCLSHSSDACVAFEVFIGAGYPGQCYNFLHNMSLPFTSSESVTCVRKKEALRNGVR